MKADASKAGKGIRVLGKQSTKKEPEPEKVPETPKVPEPVALPTGNTKLVKCTCKSNYQDKTYGKGMRIHNKMGAGRGWRCTICSTTKG